MSALTQSQQLSAVRLALGRGDLKAAARALFDAPLVSAPALELLINAPQALLICRQQAEREALARQGRQARPPLELALTQAASTGKIQKAKLLLLAGAALGNTRSQALAAAARCALRPGGHGLVMAMLSAGLDPSRPDARGDSALCSIGALPEPALASLAKALVAAGARPDALAAWPAHIQLPKSIAAPARFALSALSLAAALGRLEHLRLLHRLMGEPGSWRSDKEQGGGARSPLHWAALAGQRDTSLFLIELGFDPDAPDANGDTPFDLAARWSDAGLRGAFQAAHDRRQLGSLPSPGADPSRAVSARL